MEGEDEDSWNDNDDEASENNTEGEGEDRIIAEERSITGDPDPPPPLIPTPTPVPPAEPPPPALSSKSPFKKVTKEGTWYFSSIGDPDVGEISTDGEELLREDDPSGLSWVLWIEELESVTQRHNPQVELSLIDVRAERVSHLRVKAKVRVWEDGHARESIKVKRDLSAGGVIATLSQRTNRITVKLTFSYKERMLCNVCDDWKELLQSCDLADLTLRVGGKDMRVHRVVLCARSPVFRRMLLSDFKESKASEIEILEITYTAFSKVLEFLYTGQVQDYEGSQMDVLVAADRYEVLDLKDICQKEIQHQLNAENVLHALVLADGMGATELKNGALKVAVDNIEEVMKTSDWVDFRKNSNNLVDDILIAARNKIKK